MVFHLALLRFCSILDTRLHIPHCTKTGTSLRGQTAEVVYVLGNYHDMVLSNLRKVPWSLV